jgi:hypothetical protein
MDKIYIRGIIQNILNKEFSSDKRRTIVEYVDRLNCCCVFCGDSKNENKKRGNVYFDTLRYICFNCGKNSSFDKMCRDYGQVLDPSKKMEMIEHLNSVTTFKNYESDFTDAEFDKLIDLSEIERIFNNGEFSLTDFKPIQKDGSVYKYLVNRGIPHNLHYNIYQAKYWMGSERFEYVIVILNKKGNKVLGAQIRNLKTGGKRLFKIYNFETLYKWVTNQEEVIDIDMNMLVTYNKLSYYFNILNVDLGNKITIFEGYLDSLFYPNSIGVVGTQTDMNMLESNNLEIQYMYDNDDAGYRKSEEKIKKGYGIFLWKKLFNDIVIKKNSSDPFKLMSRISTVKDLNSLAELVNNPYKTLELNKYFSKDIYDKIHLTKPIKRLFVKKSF